VTSYSFELRQWWSDETARSKHEEQSNDFQSWTTYYWGARNNPAVPISLVVKDSSDHIAHMSYTPEEAIDLGQRLIMAGLEAKEASCT
jgi:hypothetical protein